MPEPEQQEQQEPEPSATEDLGDAGKKALAEERKARRDLEKQLKEVGMSNAELQKRLKEFEDRDKTEIDKANEAVKAVAAERDTFKSEAEKLRQERMRHKIAASEGLDPDLWDRVIGSTEEEITADVKRLVEKFAPAPRRSGALRSGASAPEGGSDKQRAALALRGMRRD